MRWLRLFAVNGLLLLLLLELAGAGVYLHRTGRLFYTDVRQAAATRPDDRSEHLSILRLHPYLGFIQRPGITPGAFLDRAMLDRYVGPGVTPPWLDRGANDEGFFAPAPYPTPAEAGALVVGIFGGSVAQWLALQGAETLRDALAASPAVAGRDVRLFSFAVAGYKQPQQLQLLELMLARGQRFDLVIDVGGFNEVALADLNVQAGVAADAPSVLHVKALVEMLDRSTLSRERLRVLARADALREDRARVERARAETRLASVWVLHDLRAQRIDRALEHARIDLLGASATPVGESLFFLRPAPAGAARDPERYARFAALWGRSARLMDATLRARGTPFLQVLQPNQYFGTRRFPPDEDAVARGGSSIYRPSVEAGYAALQAELAALGAEGVAVLDATGVFDALAEPVYADNCCHYTQRGNEVLAAAVGARARALLETAPAR